VPGVEKDPAEPGASLSPYKGTRGLKRLANATGYSMKGVVSAWKHEAAFRQEALLAAALIPVALFITSDTVERVILVGSLLLVLLVELLNSAIEAVVDRVSCDYHELSGRAKDMGSAAVLVSLIMAGTAWVCIVF